MPEGAQLIAGRQPVAGQRPGYRGGNTRRPRTALSPPCRAMTPASTRWDGIVGWVWTRPTPLKRAHLRQHPFVSCTYWDPQPDLAVAECDARWEVDPTERERVWNLVPVRAPAARLGSGDDLPGRSCRPEGRPAAARSVAAVLVEGRGRGPGRRPTVWQPAGVDAADRVGIGEVGIGEVGIRERRADSLIKTFGPLVSRIDPEGPEDLIMDGLSRRIGTEPPSATPDGGYRRATRRGLP